MKRTSTVVVLVLCVVALSSCESSKTDDSDKAKLSEEGAIRAPKGGSSTRPVNETAFVFVDRSDPEFEYAYVVSTKGVIAQVSVFPGYTNRQLFAVPHLPEPLAAGAKRWEQVPGEIRPPFIPGGPWFSRTAILLDAETPAETEYFKDSNEGLRKWLRDLRKAVVKEDCRLAELPRWIAENSQMTRRLGM